MANWSEWPKAHQITLYYRNEPFCFGSEREPIDLSDAIMLRWPHRQRSVEMRLRVTEPDVEWIDWDAVTLNRVEENIRYDLGSDGYSVSIRRLGAADAPCDVDMIWKLVVRSA